MWHSHTRDHRAPDVGLRKFVPDPPTEPQLAAISKAVSPAPQYVAVGIIDSWLHKLNGRHSISANEVRDLLLDVRNAVR